MNEQKQFPPGANLGRKTETAEEQVERLAKFLMSEVPEKLRDGGAVDNAIRIIAEQSGVAIYQKDQANGCEVRSSFRGLVEAEKYQRRKKEEAKLRELEAACDVILKNTSGWCDGSALREQLVKLYISKQNSFN